MIISLKIKSKKHEGREGYMEKLKKFIVNLKVEGKLKA